jgi:hypothetical protein
MDPREIKATKRRKKSGKMKERRIKNIKNSGK